MSDPTTQESQESYLGMSDEELSKVDPSKIGQSVEEEAVEVEDADEAPAESAQSDTDTANTDDEADEPELVDKDQDADDVVEDKEPAAEKVVPEKEEKPAVVEKDTTEVDYKAAYERLLSPFKANGREIAVKGVDDAISLMQMGANYNKKMAALKPNLKLMKMLENNGMLSEEKIGFLIDLEKKNPEAINKLVKDSGLDPMDLSADKASEYKPNTYTVDDREMELDVVLDEIQGTPTYNRTLDIVSTKWDGPSKQVIAGSPQLLKVINDHVQSGIYDAIIKEVESERVFGRLNGLSDIEAYRKVGDSIQARGGFAQVTSTSQQAPAKPVVVVPKPKVDEDTLRDKKRAASSTKPAASTSLAKDFNPLALSDDEFSKLVNKQYL